MIGADYNDKNYDYTSYWFGRDYENEAELLALKKFLPRTFDKDKSVIDIGGGYGRLILFLNSIFGKITILDYSQKQLDLTKENANKIGVSIDTIQSDIYELAKNVQTKFDYALMVRVSHHLKDLDSAFNQIYEILNDGGIFILEVANKMHFKSLIANVIKGNFRYFNRDSINIATKNVTFLNHHPKRVEALLKKSGFKIESKLSVSNFRSPFIKKFVPIKLLLIVENKLQRILSLLYFGPSIFYKVRK